ncbi:MAG: PfkB family carbohydrate kinase [Planctomycetes bacterium]|nr:PfkB family carbohydrate kinase [Planctomycetota bacterium]
MALPPESAARYESILRGFPGVRIGVVGDFLADRYIFGAPSRLSREAPVVILRWEGEHLGPGGAANAAANLVALGAKVSCVGFLGADGSGRELRRRFSSEGADASGLFLLRGARTIVKTRVLAGDRHRSKQQVIRVDREPDGPPPASAERLVLAAVRRLAPEVDAWLVSDYGYGTVTPRVFEALRYGPGGARRVVVVDSRRQSAAFRGATALTPNEDEAAEAAGLPVGTEAEVAACGEALLRLAGTEHVLLTRGNQGLALFSRGEPPAFVPVSGGNEEITDNNGAGDTVAATLTLALAAGGRPLDAARLANHAGGVVVMKPGAATLTAAELRRQYRAHGIPRRDRGGRG